MHVVAVALCQRTSNAMHGIVAALCQLLMIATAMHVTAVALCDLGQGCTEVGG